MVRAQIQAGELDRAATLVEHAMRHPVGNRVPDDVRHPALAAFVAARAGDLSRAAELAERARRSADELALGLHEPGRIFAGLARVELHVERGEDDTATQVLDECKRAGDASHRVTLQAAVALCMARSARAFGDHALAAAHLDHARVLYQAPDAAVLRVWTEEDALQALRFEPERAGAIIDGLDDRRTEARLLRLRLAVLERDERRARAILAELPPPTTRREQVERGVLGALQVLDRDIDQANARLQQALAVAMPERFVRTIVDLGPDVHRLLKSCAPDPTLQAYVDDLLTVTGGVVAPVRTKGATTLVEPLSDREITVLRYLCSRLTNPEIASALYVSPNTLKSHVRSVYRKLGVTSRAEAIVAGRQHGLI
jgi:LuxR family maltose regulon positive regulatory protein